MNNLRYFFPKRVSTRFKDSCFAGHCPRPPCVTCFTQRGWIPNTPLGRSRCRRTWRDAQRGCPHMLGARAYARPRRSPVKVPYLRIEIPQSEVIEFDGGVHVGCRCLVNCAALPSPDKMLLPRRWQLRLHPPTSQPHRPVCLIWADAQEPRASHTPGVLTHGSSASRS